MKITKWLFVPGFLAALALAGCFNPVSSPPAGSNPAAGADTETALLEPFTVTLHIGADGSARAAAGPNGTVIGSGGICNFMQLAVLEPAAGKVHALTDARQENAAQKNATLQVEKIVYEKDYEFLLLMGHWERDYGAESSGGNYKYVEDELPTLLAAGHTTARINLLNNTVNITMYPLVVDTKFTSADNAVTVNTVRSGFFSLLPGTWDLAWTVSRGAPGTDGFTDLRNVQKASPLFKKAAARVSGGTGQTPALSTEPDGNVVTLKFGALAAGNTGAANFNLTYVPFSLNTADKWNGFTGLNKKDGLPEWIIRNGVNDLAQNDKTDFIAAAAWDGTKNGNGMVGYMVAAPATIGAGDNTVIDEQNLLTVLGVPTVADAIEELHIRLNNVPNGDGTANLGGLKLGMYLDLTGGIDDGSGAPIAWNAAAQNLRIVIASFDQYKDGTNTRSHIKFVFKNVPVQKAMRSADTSDGGYPKADGDVVLKPYLEGGFFKGLTAALGRDYFYAVTRPVTGGSYAEGWATVHFAAKVFIDTEKEIYGVNPYGHGASEAGLTQTALYKIGRTPWELKKYNKSNSHWWTGSPSQGSAKYFVSVASTEASPGNSNATSAWGIVPAFCIW
ncbi:MAG: hypothetical protein LBL19_06895 [Spirochaetaceae bacterium]|jgi:hypothetical protein|nr:hypothetical protein [Spirochaetaceae bacterium]